MTLQNCKIIETTCFKDERGSLGFVQNDSNLPFAIKRVYYLYDIEEDARRGLHAHKNLEQLVILLSGTLSIELFDGMHSKEIELKKGSEGLYICPMIWREFYNFSKDAVVLVLASDLYDESDYIHNISEFKKIVNINER